MEINKMAAKKKPAQAKKDKYSSAPKGPKPANKPKKKKTK